MITYAKPTTNRVHRKHVSKETRWMHDPDEIIPCVPRDQTSFRDWLLMCLSAVGATFLMLFIWWNFC